MAMDWSEDEDFMLRFMSDCHSLQDISRTMKRPVRELIQRAKELQIQVDSSMYFSKGHIPSNKGKRGLPSVGRMKETQFKKGHKPLNTLNDGVITIRHLKSKGRIGRKAYRWIRIDRKWVELHRKIWQDAHGPVPKGMCVAFRDGDSLNCSIENLELISRRENLDRKRLLDSTVASRLCRVGQGKVDRQLKEEILRNHPQLIQLKRKQLELNQIIHETEHS